MGRGWAFLALLALLSAPCLSADEAAVSVASLETEQQGRRWLITAGVKNDGGTELANLILSLEFLDGSGKALGQALLSIPVLPPAVTATVTTSVAYPLDGWQSHRLTVLRGGAAAALPPPASPRGIRPDSHPGVALNDLTVEANGPTSLVTGKLVNREGERVINASYDIVFFDRGGRELGGVRFDIANFQQGAERRFSLRGPENLVDWYSYRVARNYRPDYEAVELVSGRQGSRWYIEGRMVNNTRNGGSAAFTLYLLDANGSEVEQFDISIDNFSSGQRSLFRATTRKDISGWKYYALERVDGYWNGWPWYTY